MNSVLAECRQAFRALAAHPTWTVASLLCLAIGTGANTAAFSAINGILLRPLPFDEPQQIVMMAIQWSEKQQAGPVSVEDFRELQAAGLPFQHLAMRTFLAVGLASQSPARLVQADFAGGDYFDLLRIRPLVGRFFFAAADRSGGPLEAVLSERLWRSHFHRDGSIIGQTVRINGRPVTVVGVAPDGFVGAMRIVAADLWLPASAFGMFAAPGAARDAESRRVFGLIGRLKPGATLGQTRDQVNSMLAHLWRVRNESGVAPVSLIERSTGFGVPPALRPIAAKGAVLLFGLMAMLVAVAVANVGGLMLARAAGRQKETAVRLALGATQFRIARQLLIESLVLAIGGATLGALVAFALPSLLNGLGPTLPDHLSFAVDVRPDWRVGIYSVLTAIAVSVLCGLAPARHATRTDSGLALRESTGNSRTRGTSRTLNAFVTGQIALSTVLLVLAILLSRTYLNTQAVDPGIDIRNTLAISLDWDQTGSDDAKGRAFYNALLTRVSVLPGVEHSALSRQPPLSPGAATVNVSAGGSVALSAGITSVTTGYFDTVRLPLLQGRYFSVADNGAGRVAIINETMARQLSAAGSPIGATFTIGNKTLEVVGVVRDAKYRSLSELQHAVFYEPFEQAYSPQMTLLVRSASDPHALIEPIRRELSSLNTDLSAIAIRTLEEQYSESSAPSRQRAIILAGTCGMALFLSAAGLFGVMSYGVRLRVRELGIRVAVGARPFDIAQMVLGQALRLVGVGLGFGLLLAFASTRVIVNVLFGVSPHDPLTVFLVSFLLAGVAFVAAFLPARWASRTDPMRSIRAD